MNTHYSEVDNLFLSKITDDFLLSMHPEDIQNLLDAYRFSAGIKFKKCKKIGNRNEDLRIFNEKLTDEELEILSNLMVLEWIKPRVNSIELLEPTMSTKDYQTFSNANHLNSLQALLKSTRNDVDRMIVSYTYSTNDLSTLGDV